MKFYELEEEFGDFIAFGKIFDPPTRRFLVEYLYARFFDKPLPALKDLSRYFTYFKHALDAVFEEELLMKIAQGNEAMSKELMHDLLKWLRKTDRKMEENNPFYEEKSSFDAWSHKPTFLWRETWYNLINYLRTSYASEQLDTSFYAAKLKELMPTAPTTLREQELADAQPRKSALDVVIDDLLAQWNALLSAKILTYQAEEIAQETEKLLEKVSGKAREYLKLMELINPIANAAGRYWDMSRGLWHTTSFEVLDRYHTLLQDEASIRQLADLLGKMREAEIELEEETFENVVVRKEWVPDPSLREEVNGIEGSNDLNRLVPSEAAFLAEPLTETVFYQKFAHQDLLSFRYEGKRLVQSSNVVYHTRQKQKKKEKGPFILCIDTSGSMHGLPAQIAKVVAFAIMKMASKEARKCFLISFSIGIRTIQLSDLANSMDDIVAFLRMSFDGGTDVTPALSSALDMLQTNDYRQADVLMISDFIMFGIRQEILDRIQREQHRGTQFHSLTISNKANREVLQVFDNTWFYEAESRTVVRQLLDDLQQI